MSLQVSNNTIRKKKNSKGNLPTITLLLLATISSFLLINISHSCNALQPSFFNILQVNHHKNMLSEFIKSSKMRYSYEVRQNFTTQLELSAKRVSTRQSTSIPTGRWLLGDLTLYDDDCNEQLIPLTVMNSTSSRVVVSHGIADFTYSIDTIIRRPLSNLYNAVLKYNSDSVPICFNIKEGELAFTSDFLLCSSVDSFTPTCQKSSSGTVTNLALLYKSPGSASSGVVAGIVIGGAMILGFILLILVCVCVCCCKMCK